MYSHHVPSFAGKSFVFVMCLSLIIAEQAMGIVTPNPTYSVDFDDPSDVTEFTSVTGGSPSPNTWTVSGGVWQHDFGGNTWSSNVSSQTVQTSGVAGQDFLVSTDFTLTARNSGNAWIVSLPVLSAMSSQLHFASASQSYYLAALRLSASPNDDRLDLVKSVESNWATSLTDSGPGQLLPFTITVGTLYHLSVTGTYDGGGNLVLSTTLTDVATPTNTLTVTTPSISSPFTGDYFGYRDEAFADSGTINYDNFVITTEIPEPASLAMLTLSLALMPRRHRWAR